MLWRMTVLSFFYAFGIKEEDTEVGDSRAGPGGIGRRAGCFEAQFRGGRVGDGFSPGVAGRGHVAHRHRCGQFPDAGSASRLSTPPMSLSCDHDTEGRGSGRCQRGHVPPAWGRRGGGGPWGGAGLKGVVPEPVFRSRFQSSRLRAVAGLTAPDRLRSPFRRECL